MNIHNISAINKYSYSHNSISPKQTSPLGAVFCDSFVKSTAVNFKANCDVKLVLPETIEKLADKIQDRTAKAVIKMFQPYAMALQDVQSKVFKEITKVADTNPKLRIEDVMRLQFKKHFGPLKSAQMRVLEKLEKADLNISANSRVKLNKFINETKEILFPQGQKVVKRKISIMHEFQNIMKECPEKKEFKKAYRIMKGFPSSDNNVDAFFVYHLRHDSKEIMKALFRPSYMKKDSFGISG